MRLHTDHITPEHMDQIVHPDNLRLAGLDENVSVRRTVHGSRSHARAFNFRVLGNGITNGGFSNDGSKAGTWDEWGVVLALLLAADPHAVIGTVKHPTYDGQDHFNRVTGWRFHDLELPEDTHYRHNWDYGVRSGKCKKCTATFDMGWW